MIWILSVETQRVHRKIFIHYVFTSQKKVGWWKKWIFLGQNFCKWTATGPFLTLELVRDQELPYFIDQSYNKTQTLFLELDNEKGTIIIIYFYQRYKIWSAQLSFNCRLNTRYLDIIPVVDTDLSPNPSKQVIGNRHNIISHVYSQANRNSWIPLIYGAYRL